jgi:hypothetical protein
MRRTIWFELTMLGLILLVSVVAAAVQPVAM